MLAIASVARSRSSIVVSSSRRNLSISNGSVGSFFNRLFNVPKGFRNYFPKNGSKAAENNANASTKQSKTTGGGPGGGGGKKKPDDDSQNSLWGTLLALGLIPVLYAMNGDGTIG